MRESNIDVIKADKFQASLGLPSRRGRLIYGLAVTENVKNLRQHAGYRHDAVARMGRLAPLTPWHPGPYNIGTPSNVSSGG